MYTFWLENCSNRDQRKSFGIEVLISRGRGSCGCLDLASLELDFQPKARVSLRIVGGMEEETPRPRFEDRLPHTTAYFRSVPSVIRRP